MFFEEEILVEGTGLYSLDFDESSGFNAFLNDFGAWGTLVVEALSR